MRWMRHADELLEHLFSHRKVGDDTVLHRSNGADVARNTPKHLLGFPADGMNRSFTVRTSFLTNGNDTRFVEDNSLSTHINERIGGGTTEVGLISLGGMVYAGSLRVGGDKFDQAIINYIRRNFGMLIGEPTAEYIKKQIGSAFPGSEMLEIEVKGRNIAEGVPRTFTVHSNEVLEALTEPLNQIVVAVKNALEKTPPELGADIAEHGLMLTGGGALLRDIDLLLKEETGLPVHVAEEPLNCVVKGCGIALENMEKLRTAFAAG